ncbi:response regulator transcription factor [Streptomyces sp. NPDC020742]|uniref:response regulator transcription factor n=1 Tax=unclassified Streptomyces TaxID=2593676 RepID=UPI0033D588E3
MHVLVVEGEAVLADRIGAGLRREAITADLAHDGHEALDRLRPGTYDVLVLDRDLPGLHGDEVCRQVAQERLPTRVLMLTAAGTVHHRAGGLGMGLGADDYLTKPFTDEELVARVLALGRRARRPARTQVIERAGVTADTAQGRALRDGRPLALSRQEFGVLEVLLRAEGAVVGEDELIEEVWEEHTRHRGNAVRVTLSALRAKLGDPPVIEAVPGAGYRLV